MSAPDQTYHEAIAACIHAASRMTSAGMVVDVDRAARDIAQLPEPRGWMAAMLRVWDAAGDVCVHDEQAQQRYALRDWIERHMGDGVSFREDADTSMWAEERF